MVKIKDFLVIINQWLKYQTVFMVVIGSVVKIKHFLVILSSVVKIKQFLVIIGWWL